MYEWEICNTGSSRSKRIPWVPIGRLASGWVQDKLWICCQDGGRDCRFHLWNTQCITSFHSKGISISFRTIRQPFDVCLFQEEVIPQNHMVYFLPKARQQNIGKTYLKQLDRRSLPQRIKTCLYFAQTSSKNGVWAEYKHILYQNFVLNAVLGSVALST